MGTTTISIRFLSSASFLLATVSLVAQDDEPPPVEIIQEWFPEELAHSITSGKPGWLPLYFELKNRSDVPREVVLNARVRAAPGGKSGLDFEMTRRVEVNPGPPKKVFAYVRYPALGGNSPSACNVSVEAFVGHRQIHRRSYSVVGSPGDGFRALPVVVSGERADDMESFLEDLSRSSFALGNRNPLQVSVDQPQLYKLPDDPIGYHSFRALILLNPDDTTLEEQQVKAIRDWVYLGGVVIFVPSRQGEVFSTRLFRLLIPPEAIGPVQIEASFKPLSLFTDDRTLDFESDEALDRVTQWKRDEEKEGDWSLFRVDPVDPEKAEPDRVVMSADPESGAKAFETRQRVYYEVPYGAGKVGVLTVDAISLWRSGTPEFLETLWRMILGDVRTSASDLYWNDRTARFVDGNVVKFLKRGLSPDLGLWFIGSLVVLYLALIGPGVYFSLKRINRLPWVIWMEPTIVVLYVGMIFLAGYLTKGVLTETRTLSVLHWLQGDPFILKESYLGIFSSDDSKYRISALRDRWMRPVFANDDEATGIRMNTRGEVVGTSEATVSDYRLDVWQTGVFSTMDLLEKGDDRIDIQVTEAPDGSGSTSSVSITNNSRFSIAQGLYFKFSSGAASDFVATGALAPGESVRLEGAAFEKHLSLHRLNPEDGEVTAGFKEAFNGDELLLDAVKEVRGRGRFYSSGGTVRFIGILERRDDDFEVGRGSSRIHRADLLVVSAISRRAEDF